MKPFRDLIGFEEAKDMIMERAKPLARTERVPLFDALGRVLAEAVHSPIDVPGFTRAAMDGYAVRAEDTFGAARMSPRILGLTGKIPVGKMPGLSVGKGTCAQIATGAPLPKGADAVVPVEETDDADGSIRIFRPAHPGAYVSAPNSDVAKGDKVLSEGTTLDPPHIGAAAALGMNELKVYAKPSVAVFPTGDEISGLGEPLREGAVYDINSYTLAALMKASGAEVEIFDIVPDTAEGLKGCLKEARGFDCALFSGGSSVGERDMLAGVLSEIGNVRFHGIALKPGKPTLFGNVRGTLVFGLPGYPASCLTNAYVLVRPAVRAMAHLPQAQRVEEAVLAERILSTIGRHQLYTVRAENGVARPAFKESSAITSMSNANGWIEIPQNTEFLEKGTKVSVYFF
ncbi:MAG: molybdopterin molybdotransferase MoeA [Euryarchaeota archaeon]|nr:molybdopterin molybdotransferase MoeA [Euryarchaeota archaeon]